MWNVFVRGRLAFAVAGGLLLSCAATLPASATAYRVITKFCRQNVCKDGGYPQAGLVMDQSGNLYGASAGDGFETEGAVFELVPDGRKWKQAVLHRFCSESRCADGSRPFGALVVDAAGSLYGTTYEGGAYGYGVVFELTPNADHSKWKIQVLHDFCSDNICTDGGFPMAGLAYAGQSSGMPYDGKSALYGTTYQGRAQAGNLGVVFEIKPHGKHWEENTLYSFCSLNPCTDGGWPLAGVTVDASSNLYGTTSGEGSHNSGVVYELSPGKGGAWSEKVLYSFCSVDNCADGADPYSGVILDSSGNLYGTTEAGGIDCKNNNPQCGVIYKLTPDGVETVLYAFCSQANCTDGAIPYGGVIMDPSGNLFGTTIYGGNSENSGVLFELNDSYTVLHTFCSNEDNCADGAYPEAGLLLDGAGRFFGTTEGGGLAGTVFEFTQ
jgi:uncharacterized repeat protein (TIGR03803 family)